MRSDRFSCHFLFFTLLLLSGCKTMAPVQLPAPVQTPATFTGSSDTISIGTIPWKEFFADRYLTGLIDTALRRNPDLQMAIQRIEIARARVRINSGALLPSLNAVASAGVDKFGEYTLNGVGNYDTNLSDNIGSKQRIPTNPTPDYFLGLRSSWEIDVWGKLRHQKKAAYARFLATEKGRQLVVTSLVAQVASLYYELLALDSQLEIIRKNIRLQQTALEIIQVQKMGGRATELAVNQFEAQLLNTQSLEPEVQQEIVNTENLLNLLLGRFPQPIARGLPIRQQPIPAEILEGIPSVMLRRRPDIQQAELELLAAKADVSAARAAFLPSLTITSYTGFNAFSSALLLSSPGSLAYGILGGLSAPLFQKNQIKANYQSAVAGNQEVFYAYQKAVLTGYREVVTSLKSVENFEKVARYKERQVTVLNQAVSTANDLFVTGYATYLEVVSAQRSVLEAEIGFTNARKAQFLSIIDLYRSLGGGWEPL